MAVTLPAEGEGSWLASENRSWSDSVSGKLCSETSLEGAWNDSSGKHVGVSNSSLNGRDEGGQAALMVSNFEPSRSTVQSSDGINSADKRFARFHELYP